MQLILSYVKQHQETTGYNNDAGYNKYTAQNKLESVRPQTLTIDIVREINIDVLPNKSE